MSIEEIPADQNIEMTEFLHRLFNAGGCDPMCHNCESLLPVGSIFKLSTIKSFKWQARSYVSIAEEALKNENSHVQTKEVMLCENCTPELFLQKERKNLSNMIKEYKSRKQGCFRVNGKISKT